MTNINDLNTMDAIREELNKSVDLYNAAKDGMTKAELALDHKNLVAKYNEMSLLQAYADCMKANHPVAELAKKYYYETISVKDAPHDEVEDGVKKTTIMRSVKDGTKKFDVVKFVEWTSERNQSIAADKYWRTKMMRARTTIEEEWKKFFASKGDSRTMSIGKTKKAMQELFDALVFIKSESGKNAIVASGAIAKWMLGFANNRKDSFADGKVSVTGYVLSRSTWSTLLLDAMHMAVEGKEFDIIIGDPEDVAQDIDIDAKTKAQDNMQTEA